MIERFVRTVTLTFAAVLWLSAGIWLAHCARTRPGAYVIIAIYSIFTTAAVFAADR